MCGLGAVSPIMDVLGRKKAAGGSLGKLSPLYMALSSTKAKKPGAPAPGPRVVQGTTVTRPNTVMA